MAGTWIDGAADTLARKHCLQVDFVKHWIMAEHITSDTIKTYYEMPSVDFLGVLWGTK